MKHTLNLSTIHDHLKRGGIIAYPTEGVWGLGCDPYNETAVLRILELKGRELEKGLILVASGLQQIDMLLEGLPLSARQQLQSACPGPDTWLIPDPNQKIPSWIKGSFATVAVRVSQHPVVKSLCGQCGLLVSSSANPAGKAPALSEQEVANYFKEEIMIVPGELGGQDGPSRIIDLQSGRVVRS